MLMRSPAVKLESGSWAQAGRRNRGGGPFFESVLFFRALRAFGRVPASLLQYSLIFRHLFTKKENAIMRIHTIEHVPFEGPGAIARYARTRGHALARTRIFDREPLPPLDEADLIVIMGGPMSVHDEDRLPWLVEEKRYLCRAIDAGARCFGVCLGAQLLAEALGGRVGPNHGREIGWFPVRLTPEGAASPIFAGLGDEFAAFHWHGETFSIPPGATWAAESDACRHQAFEARGRIVGLQFHLETTAENMELLISHCSDELEPSGAFVQSPEEMRARRALADSTWPLLCKILDNLMEA